jgi:hypothetical protein
MYKITADDAKTFDFQVEGSDEVYSVPLLSKLPISLLLKAQKYYKDINDEEFELDVLEFFDFLGEIFDPYAPGLLKTLSMEQAALLFKAYQDASTEGTSTSPMGE